MRILRLVLIVVFIIAVVKLFLYSQNTFIKALESEKDVLSRQAEFTKEMQNVYGDFRRVLGNIYNYIDLRAKEYEVLRTSLSLQEEKLAGLRKQISEIREDNLRLRDDFAKKEQLLQANIEALKENLKEKEQEYEELNLRYVDLLNKFSSPLILKKRIKELRSK